MYPFDNERYPMSEAIELEEKLGVPFHKWKTDLADGSVKALAGFVWLVLKRNGQATPLEDIISGAYELSESDIEIEQEGGEDPTEAPSPAGRLAVPRGLRRAIRDPALGMGPPDRRRS